VEVLEAVTEAGGRLALKADVSEREVTQIADCLAKEGLLPDGQRLGHEPTQMDPVLGVTAYLEPDFAVLTLLRASSRTCMGGESRAVPALGAACTK
jgi:hypothetical protein